MCTYNSRRWRQKKNTLTIWMDRTAHRSNNLTKLYSCYMQLFWKKNRPGFLSFWVACRLVFAPHVAFSSPTHGGPKKPTLVLGRRKVQKSTSSMICISFEKKKSIIEYEYDVLKNCYWRNFYVIENLSKWSEHTSSFSIFTIDHN